MASRFLKMFKPGAAKSLDFATLAAKFEEATLLAQQGEVPQATATFREILELQPNHVESLFQLAEIEAGRLNPEAALRSYTEIIKLKPDHATAYYKRGNLLQFQGRSEAALADYDRAVSLAPSYANAFCNRGVVLARLNRLDEALGSYNKAIALDPADALAYYNRGGVLRDLKRWDEAIASYDQAIAVRPNYAEAYFNRGNLFQERQEWDAALSSYDKCIAIFPAFSQVYLSRGNLLRETRKLDEALTSYSQAIQIDPSYAEAHCNRGIVFRELRRSDDALASLDRAIDLKPDFAEAHFNRGQLLAQATRIEVAIASFDKAIELKPDYAEALYSRAAALTHIQQFGAAVASFDRAFALEPDLRYLAGSRRHAKMHICDWSDLESDIEVLRAGIEAGAPRSPPLPILALLDCARLQRQVAEIWVAREHPAEYSLPEIARRAAGGKISLGYFSADFFDHPVGTLAAEFLEAHDRKRYEVTAFSFGPDTQDPVRKRLERAFDQFIDVCGQSDREIALLSRGLGIDIAVDMGGHTGNSRTRIFAQRAAPLQINYLGYPGTMGARYMDYLIGDRTVVPESQQHHYTEKIVYLPHCYLPYDSAREIADTEFAREDLGLPLVGFVFCCFNNNYKITPGVFDVWMRILKRTEHSLLWLSQNNPTAASNLRKEAERRGIEGRRLIFASRMSSLPEHLARYRAAGLFLDTLPYNAHATALDALWAGLPVLTCAGDGFAGRVAASALKALELPELVAFTVGAYEDLAVQLAANPPYLAELRQKLARNRQSSALFNTSLYVRHLEAAYARMYVRYHEHLPPAHIYVKC